MSEEPVTDEEWLLAAADIEAVWLAIQQRRRARVSVLAVEMVIQGMAHIHGIDAEAIRRDLGKGRAGLNAAFMAMPVQGNA